MGRAEKIYVQMQNNPLDWRIEDIDVVARHFCLTATRPGKGGSHVTYRAENGAKITVPTRRPIKAIYIVKLIQLIEGLNQDD